MKLQYIASPILAALIIGVGSTAISAGPSTETGTALPPSNAKISIHVAESIPAESSQITGNSVAPATQWDSIKDSTYEMREQFFAGMEQLRGVVETQINELVTKRATLAKSADTKVLDLAIQEMNNGRFFLNAMSASLRHATSETWNERKAKVGLAWAQTQEAYAKTKGQKSG